MALKINTSMIKVEAGKPAETIAAVVSTAGANLDALKRSLKSMKFVPQLADTQTYEENELEIGRAKSVLDQMAMQAEELMSKEQFAGLLKDAINASDIEVSPEVHEKLIEHINGKENWKYDVLSMPAPEVDNAREVLDKFLDSITAQNDGAGELRDRLPETLPEAVADVVDSTVDLETASNGQSVNEPSLSNDIPEKLPEGIADSILKAAGVAELVEAAPSIDADKSNIEKLKLDLKTVGQGKSTSPADRNNEKLELLSKFRAKNPHLAAHAEVKTLDAEITNARNTFGEQEIKIESPQDSTEKRRAHSSLSPTELQNGVKGSGSGPSIDLGLGDALAAMTRGVGGIASAAASAGKSLFKPTKAAPDSESVVSRQQRAVARSLRKASDDLVSTTNSARQLDEKLEAEFVNNGGSVELDASGKWSPETVAAMTQDSNLAPLLKAAAAGKAELVKKTRLFEKEAAKFGAVEAKAEAWDEDDLKHLGEHVDKLSGEVKKGLKSDSIPTPKGAEEDKNMMAKLVEMVQKLLAMIKALILGKKAGVENARVEPKVDLDNFSPQP